MAAAPSLDGSSGALAADAEDRSPSSGGVRYKNRQSRNPWRLRPPHTVARRLRWAGALRAVGLPHDFDVDIAASLSGFRVEATLWLTVAPTVLTTVTRALAGRPQVAYAAAITGSANIAAVVACRDLAELYDYLATGVGSLAGVHAAAVATTVRRVKSSGTVLF